MEGFEGAASLIFEVAALPVLQDTSSAGVMGNWSAIQRDFVIIGAENEEVARYNLTVDGLDDDANREMVHAALVEAAEDVE